MFSFRYKLSLIISTVALFILSLSFIAVDRVIEKEFRIIIDQRLILAQDIVSQRLQDSFDRLFSQAVTVSDSKLIQDVLTDKSISKVTRDDIVAEEILPRLTNVNKLLVTDDEGELLANSSEDGIFWQHLNKQPAFESGTSGEEAAGLVVLGNQWLQWVMLPIFIGDQLFGSTTLVCTLGEQELQSISQLTGTELLIANKTAFLATDWNGHKVLQDRFAASSKEMLTFNEFVNNKRSGLSHSFDTEEINLQGERYLLRYKIPDNPSIPPFVVAQSLDQALAFVQTIKQVMWIIALMSLLIAGALGFIFASSVSRPILSLRKATRAIAEEDFEQRVNIQTRDEFRELGESFNQMSESLAEKAKIRTALDKSVSKKVANHLLHKGVQLGGETRQVTILFADIRDFTSLSEQLSENQLLELLNEYFTRINFCIQQFQGTIDKFIGDAVMAIFGAPTDDPLHACHAIQAALAMTEAIELFNEEVSTRFNCQIDIGVGLNTGKVVSGLVGSDDRLNYTVLGDQVNIASRVEGLNKFYGADIIITDDTRLSADEKVGEGNDWVYRRLDNVQLKGKTIAVNLFQPLRAREADSSMLHDYDEALESMFQHEFQYSMKKFETLTASSPDDKVLQVWLERTKIYSRQPEYFDRDYQQGIRILKSK